jgi:dihydrofolate synthase/folylpolyglutamate synthase
MDDDADPRYRDVLARLEARGRFGVRLGLARTRALLNRLGDPQHGLRGALIGGTNGKGSTQALVASVLREAGYRVGQMPKPHLMSYRERILVDGHLISATDFADTVEEVLIAADKVEARHGPPTEFEVLTAAAFMWFARAGLEVAVVEVGLGGRLDATNVWQGGVSAITNVALDHMEYLGDTVEKIAAEKAHIIKSGDAVAVTGAIEPALSVIAQRARSVDVLLSVRERFDVARIERTATVATNAAGDELRVGLLGRHQAANAAVADGIVDGLIGIGFNVSNELRHRGMANARWPGRLELINRVGRPDILLDGAHNPAGVQALSVGISDLLPQVSGSSPTFLIGILANHWQEGMIDPLIDVAPKAALITTRVPDAAGASMDPEKIAFAWGAGAVHIADPDRAFDSALQRASQTGGTLVVCGSLYLVGYVRAKLIAQGVVE